jgi:transcriptional regulator with XRE-family HTH domain
MSEITLNGEQSLRSLNAYHAYAWANERKSQFLAEKIENRMRESGLTKMEFAKVMDVQPSIITRWLSGKHNFTVETIFDIERKLNFLIFEFSDNKRRWGIHLHLMVQTSITHMPNTGELVNALGKTSFQSFSKSGTDDDSSPLDYDYNLPYQVFEAISDLLNSK